MNKIKSLPLRQEVGKHRKHAEIYNKIKSTVKYVNYLYMTDDKLVSVEIALLNLIQIIITETKI